MTPQSPREQVLIVASGMLAGELGIIEGSRRLLELRTKVSTDDHDPDFLPFAGIDSETDALPLGGVRQHWATEALAREDVQIQAMENHFREYAFAACRKLLDRFGDESPID